MAIDIEEDKGEHHNGTSGQEQALSSAKGLRKEQDILNGVQPQPDRGVGDIVEWDGTDGLHPAEKLALDKLNPVIVAKGAESPPVGAKSFTVGASSTAHVQPYNVGAQPPTVAARFSTVDAQTSTPGTAPTTATTLVTRELNQPHLPLKDDQAPASESHLPSAPLSPPPASTAAPPVVQDTSTASLVKRQLGPTACSEGSTALKAQQNKKEEKEWARASQSFAY